MKWGENYVQSQKTWLQLLNIAYLNNYDTLSKGFNLYVLKIILCNCTKCEIIAFQFIINFWVHRINKRHYHIICNPLHNNLSIIIEPLIHNLLYFPTAAAAKSLQSCPTLCNPIDGSPPGSAVPGILQARILECVAISSSSA